MITAVLPCSKRFLQNPQGVLFEAGNFAPPRGSTITAITGIPNDKATLNTNVFNTTVTIINKGFRLDVIFKAINQTVDYPWSFLTIKNTSDSNLFVFATGFLFGDLKHWYSDVIIPIPGNMYDSSYKEPMSLSGEGLIPLKPGEGARLIGLGGNIERVTTNFTAYLQVYIGELTCLGGE